MLRRSSSILWYNNAQVLLLFLLFYGFSGGAEWLKLPFIGFFISFLENGRFNYLEFFGYPHRLQYRGEAKYSKHLTSTVVYNTGQGPNLKKPVTLQRDSRYDSMWDKYCSRPTTDRSIRIWLRMGNRKVPPPPSSEGNANPYLSISYHCLLVAVEHKLNPPSTKTLFQNPAHPIITQTNKTNNPSSTISYHLSYGNPIHPPRPTLPTRVHNT